MWQCALFGCLRRLHIINSLRTKYLPLTLLVTVFGNLIHIINADSATLNEFVQIFNGFRDCKYKTFSLYDGYRLLTEFEHHKTKVDSLEECLQSCRHNTTCLGVNYDGETCQYITQSNGQLVWSNNNEFSFNTYAEKICINDKLNRCLDRLWALEHLVGYQLTSNSHSRDDSFFLRKQFANVRSVGECSQLCLDERSLVCRSALFNSTSGDCVLTNLDRQTIDSTHTDRTEMPSQVTLSRIDPFSSDIHYLENKCIEEPKKFCDFRRIKNKKLKTSDNHHLNVNSGSECRELCLTSKSHCGSYDYDFDTKICRLSHLSELTSAHIVEPYLQVNGSVTYELSTCYNVSVVCEQKAMKVQIETSKLFSGKIYAKTRPRNCMNDVNNALSFSIALPYIDSVQPLAERRTSWTSEECDYCCDTRQSDIGHFSNDIVIQHHDLVLTTKDLSLGVYCKFDLQNDSIAKIDLKIQGDILTEKLKGSAALPELSLHVVDYLGHDIDEVTIGDLLRVQIRMSDEATYGIFVRNLLVRDSFNQTRNFTLIDNKGCPVQLKMMREMRTLDQNSKSLESYLEAFTFTGGTLLLIEAEVETCLDQCRPMQCQVATGRSDDDIEMVTSYGRRRRRSIVTDVEQAEKGDILSMTMLSKSLLVRPHVDAGELTTMPPQKPSLESTLNNYLAPPRRDHQVRSTSKAQHSTTTSKPVHSEVSSPKPTKTPYRPAQPSKLSPLNVRKKGSFVSGYVRATLSDQGYVCFEPLNLFLVYALSFCVQGVVFWLLFYVFSRNRVTLCGVTPMPPSQSMSHHYLIGQPYMH